MDLQCGSKKSIRMTLIHLTCYALFNKITKKGSNLQNEALVQWNPLNWITLGQRESDSIIRMITIRESPSLINYLTESDWGLGKSRSL